MAPSWQPRRQQRQPTIAVIYNPRQGQVKNGEIVVFQGFWQEVPLFAWEGTDI
jgi:hypothetical protein